MLEVGAGVSLRSGFDGRQRHSVESLNRRWEWTLVPEASIAWKAQLTALISGYMMVEKQALRLS
jgi:hypothetical protein